jgi:formylglycine-generating enzyme required for sulfatase activity
VTKLLAQVKTYLGEDGWFWLQACAVYPQLTWELTLYLGARLLGVTAGSPAKGDWAERVLQLVRLPWFRYGALPDWLRGELVARFTPPQAARVRGVIAELLQHVLTKPGAAIPLEMATEPAPEPRRWRRWLAAAAARLAAWWRLQRLYRLLQGQAPENQMRDYVLLSFLAGRQLKPLSVQAPKLWERLLFQHGLRAWGGNPVTVGVVALGVAAACFWWFYWEPMRRLPNRLFDESYLAGSYKPFATPTRDPNVSLTPTPTPVVTPTVRPTAKPAVMPATSQGGPGEVGNPDVAAAPLEAPKGEWPVVKVDGGYRVEMPNGVTLNLVSVAGGEFMMGWDKSDYDFEKPAHRVRLSGFNLGKYEVTQEQWLAVMGGKNPSNFQGDKLPVEQVLWDEAREFCQRLTAKTGVPFDLPTEAQWEYAARAGWPGEYGFNGGASQLGQYAWYVENSGNKTHPVGQKQPNRWGLYDMHGNVWEWCRDWYGDSYYAELQKQGTAVNPQGPNKGSTRVLRGGSWFSGSVSARAVFRYHGTHPAVRGDNVGFRVVVVSPPS